MKIHLSRPLYETKPNLPNFYALSNKIREVYQTAWLTNNGAQVQQLEKKLEEFLDIDNVTVFCNGTLALQIALQALELEGEVITTPFTFPATTMALTYNNLTPVFCDIEPEHFNIDPDKIEELITPKTSAILPVHIFGNPCDVEKIEQIAKKHNLKVIYDAAHSFGVRAYGRSISSYGDVNMYSFHATKKFHTLEGGALAYNDPLLRKKFMMIKNFGYDGYNNILSLGTNAKMNEIEALFGLLLLPDVKKDIEERKKLFGIYRDNLRGLKDVRFLTDMDGVKHNYLYFIITSKYREKIQEALEGYDVHSRRRFYPLCSDVLDYKDLPSARNLPVAKQASEETLSLPLFKGLTSGEVISICEIIKDAVD